MPQELEIDRLIKSEQKTAADILAASFGEDHRTAAEKDIAVSFTDYPYAPVSMIAKMGDKPVGFVQVVPSYFHPRTFSIAWLAVLPEFRKQRLGAKILHYAEQWLQRERFRGSDGTMLLAAVHKPQYYERLGYKGELFTHDGYPIMVKYARDMKAT